MMATDMDSHDSKKNKTHYIILRHQGDEKSGTLEMIP